MFRAEWAPPLYGSLDAVATFDLSSPGEQLDRISTEARKLSFFAWFPLIGGIVLIALIAVAVIGSRRTRRARPDVADDGLHDPSTGARLSR